MIFLMPFRNEEQIKNTSKSTIEKFERFHFYISPCKSSTLVIHNEWCLVFTVYKDMLKLWPIPGFIAGEVSLYSIEQQLLYVHSK